jgi:hypothetical protein
VTGEIPNISQLPWRLQTAAQKRDLGYHLGRDLSQEKRSAKQASEALHVLTLHLDAP